jgi:hypothetical protein
MWDAVRGGLQPQPWHHNAIWAPPYPNIPKLVFPSPARYNSVRMDPCTLPQHMKVHKHFIYIQYGCMMQSVGVYSLNHDTTTSLGLHLTPIFQNLAPTITGITVQGCTHMPIQSIWMCSNTSYTSNMDVGCSQWGLQPQPWHCNMLWALPYPNFPKFCPPPQV